MKMLRFLITILIFSALNACSTLSKEECLQGNWYKVGHDDGREGYHSSRYTDHQKACKEYKVTLNYHQYNQGYDDGVELYCVHEKGYREGENVNKYNNVCPAPLENDFLRGYIKGLQQAEDALRWERDSIRDDIYRVERRYHREENEKEHDRLKREIDSLESSLNSLDSKYDRIADYLSDARRLLD